MYRGKKVSVIVPAYNEVDSIASVINGFFATGFVDEVIAVDNNAPPAIGAEIEKTKARRVVEPKQGYGHSLMRGMKEATGDIMVMVEADGTYLPTDIEKFLLYATDFDVVFGTRTSPATIWSGAFMPWMVRFGNWYVAKFVQVLHNAPTLTDVGCTYKLLTRRAFEKIQDLFPQSKGDGKFSPELMIWIIRRGLKSVEIPVMYLPRVGESFYTGSVWKAAKLGFRMIPLIVKYRSFRF
jgi:glycosyltransferase involved in cell wall biosynthesis